MAVKTALVKEFLIDRVFGEVEDRYPGEVSDRIEAALARAPELLLRAETRSAQADSAAVELARRGYLERVVETELFERARQPLPSIEAGHPEQSDWVGPAAQMSAELARLEPAEKPDPRDDGWTSWRVPGPGGHVRHYLALMSAFTLFAEGDDSPPVFPEGVGESDLKRSWMYGFYLRCYEESASGEPRA